MNVSLKFGRGEVGLEVPEHNLLGIVEPRESPGVPDPEAEVRRALAEPIGCGRLSARDLRGRRVVVMVSDVTRPSPTAVLLPPLLEELEAAGTRREDVTIVFGMGIHRPHTPEEQRALVGERVFSLYRCVDSSQLDTVVLGRTSRGTPIEVVRPVAEADVKIGTGNIELHYFAGYSGGAKAFMPGASTRRAIEHNHAMQFEEGAGPGRLEGNPVRQDIDEWGEKVGIDFILNAVLNSRKEIVSCVAGHFLEAHRAGCRLVDAMYKVPVPGLADVVVASAGGHPKDINVYQAQKALDNACWAVKPGGAIIWVASCREGFGEKVFEQWMMEAEKPQDLVDRIRAGFVLGGHKAAAIARVLQRARVRLVSELPPGLVRALMCEPFASVGAAWARCVEEKPDLKALIMPYAGSTLPVPAGAG